MAIFDNFTVYCPIPIEKETVWVSYFIEDLGSGDVIVHTYLSVPTNSDISIDWTVTDQSTPEVQAPSLLIPTGDNFGEVHVSGLTPGESYAAFFNGPIDTPTQIFYPDF